MRRIEKHYGKTVRVFMNIANPVKKRIIKTNCYVHKYINERAVDILEEENHEAFEFFQHYIGWLNFGVYWADQDFKSSNHFFYLHREKGMYGFSNALHECEKQYNIAIHCAKDGKKERAIFHLGEACHLVQDSTVPHHVMSKLLKEHRPFEQWILKRVNESFYCFNITGVIMKDSVGEYIKANGNFAYDTYIRYGEIENKDDRYEKISSLILERAISSTAGMLLDFYNKYIKK